MRKSAATYPIMQVELWHAAMVGAVFALLVPLGVIEPYSLLVGGLFMGVNFLLLGQGIRRVLTPFAGKGRIRSGVILLTLKLLLFLGLLSAFFLKFPFDAMSFSTPLHVQCSSTSGSSTKAPCGRAGPTTGHATTR